jgi:2-C-methyl-D-erythritol 4-phosphate cytidylyltransferase
MTRSASDEIILVVRDGMQPHFAELAEKYHFQKPFRIVVGGAERQDSVWNGWKRFRRGGNCGHSGCGAALHERGVDCGDIQAAR